MKARREKLATVSAPSHAGLWLDRFLEDQTEEGSAADDAKGKKANLILGVTGMSACDLYHHAYARWRQGFDPKRVLTAEATVCGRMIIGLGQKGALEAGIRLDHTWGVPVIPGSALKGLAATTAHQILDDEGWRKRTRSLEPANSFEVLFGTTDEQGAVAFHDAWWIPTPDRKLPLHLDVMTVHHPKYYQSRGKKVPPPSDMDSPTPIPFTSATGTYLLALEGEPEWCDVALGILEIGLAELGVGAKANAGYGRMTVPGRGSRALQAIKLEATRQSQAAELATQMAKEHDLRVAKQKRELAELDDVIGRLSNPVAAQHVPEHLKKYDGSVRREFARMAISKLGAFLKEPKRRELMWVRELHSAAAEPAEASASEAMLESVPRTPSAQQPAPVVQPALIAEAWEPITAWLAPDKKKPKQMMVCYLRSGMAGDRAVKDVKPNDVAEALAAASSVQPLACEGRFKGSKLEALRPAKATP